MRSFTCPIASRNTAKDNSGLISTPYNVKSLLHITISNPPAVIIPYVLPSSVKLEYLDLPEKEEVECMI
jgi:hypothetical protein